MRHHLVVDMPGVPSREDRYLRIVAEEHNHSFLRVVVADVRERVTHVLLDRLGDLIGLAFLEKC